jgi:hypothetical protein
MVKRLIWFFVNFVGMMTPFRQIRKAVWRLGEKIKEIGVKLARLVGYNSEIKFLE